ncbi:MAG: polar amino acid transport system substrate-binding protein [Psychromonas sp.]|jgi:polar amino acid transport system substrate-binding protein
MAVNAAGLVSEGKLTVGMEISYPPFESYDGNKIVGFDPELAALLAEKMAIKETFTDSKFTNLILSLKSNKFDTVISGPQPV